MSTHAISPSVRLPLHFNIDNPADPNSCWTWIGARSSQGGYPGFTVDGQFVYGHTYAYAQAFGEPPAGYHVHHVCENKRCVNPAHLEALSPEEHRARHAVEMRQRTYLRARVAHHLAAAGMTASAIAEAISRTPETVRDYLRLAAVAA
jgi:hypothetical protein